VRQHRLAIARRRLAAPVESVRQHGHGASCVNGG
jgi:hypothetical protein